MGYYLILTDAGINTRPMQADTPAALAAALTNELKNGKAAAIQVTSLTDITAGAVPAAFTTAETNRASLVTKAQAAVAANVTFLAITNPTAAQVATQAKALTRQVDALIKLALSDLTDTAGT